MTRMSCIFAALVVAWPYASSSAQRVASAPLGKAGTLSSEAKLILARPVTAQFDHLLLRQAIRVLGAAAGISVSYQRELLDAVQHDVSGHFDKTPLGDAFAQVLAGTSLQLVVSSRGQVSITPMDDGSTLAVREGLVTGTVSDTRTGRPLRGAKVGITDTQRATETGEDGHYRLPLPSGRHSLTIRLLGYARVVRTVDVGEGGTIALDIALTPSAMTLDQVVVTGTVIPTELKAVPSAITVITAKQIEERGITKIDQLFRGDVPGLFALNPGSSPNAFVDEVTMFSRGATALSGYSAGTDGLTNPIKTYVDGVELANPKYLSQIDPKSIERIEILTGPQASTIYGSNAINGVMQIFTKRGTSPTPQLTLSLLSGWVENNFSPARTPQHDYSALLNGIEGRMSYNAGGSWNYMGAWTPAKQTTRMGGFGGVRLDLPTTLGRVTTDVTLRRTITQNHDRGSTDQTVTGYQETGWYRVSRQAGLDIPATHTLTGQTLGLVLGYTLTTWWSHELGMGVDASDQEERWTAQGYKSPQDTMLLLRQNHTDRRSLRYTTTVRVPVTSLAQATVTAGADAWQDLTSSLIVQPAVLTGSLTNINTVSRQPDHNTGGFLQTQLGVGDRLFLTYGLRAEWNPSFGKEAEPNYAPRYGVAYTQEVGSITTKLRASYGRSTRPPQIGLKAAMTAFQAGWGDYLLQDYGNFDIGLANPELTPEHQQGGEGGVEVYLGTRASLVVTRYNQTVDHLIDRPPVDSVRSLTPNPTSYYENIDADGYGYIRQYQSLNVASIRNQGWELQGSVQTGPLTTRGTYSWTKSRTIGVNPKYRAYFANQPQYRPGATFLLLPEHTWAFGTTYARSATTVGINLTGTGRVTTLEDDFYFRNLFFPIRLPQNRLSFSDSYVSFNSGYALADLTASHRFVSRVEGVLEVQNLANRYMNDGSARFAVMGRQVKLGARVR